MKHTCQIALFIWRALLTGVVVSFLAVSMLSGQELADVETSFQSKTVAVDQGTTFTNFLVVENKSDRTITVRDITPTTNYPGLVYFPRSENTISPGTGKRLIIKFIANVEFMKMETDSVTFEFTIDTGEETENRRLMFQIQKEEEKQVVIYPFSREKYINPAEPESTVFIFAENRGYSQRNIKLDIQSLPNGLEITPKQYTFLLEGLEKRMIEFKVSVRNKRTLFPDYSIQIRATDLVDQSSVATSTVKVIVLSHNRQIGRPGGTGGGTNYAEVAYTDHSSGLNYMQFRGNTEFSAEDHFNGRINVTADYYRTSGLYNLYDTWLELQRRGTELRLGSIYGADYDYSISGRGGKISRKIGSDKEVELLALENNYMLLGTYFPQTKGAKMVGAKYLYGEREGFNGKVSYIYDHDPRLSITTHVTNFSSSAPLSSGHNLRFEAGLSHEKGWINKDKSPGVSAGLNYDGEIGKWRFHSINSYGSGNYAGLNRGSFHFNQRVDLRLSDHNRLFMHYHNAQIQPEYLSFQSQQSPPGGSFYPEYFYSSQNFKTGYQHARRTWNVLIAPQVEKQKNTVNSDAHELLAYRIQTNLGTSFGSHGLHLTAEYSYSKAAGRPDWFHGFRANMLYRYRSFSLNSSAQWNPTSVIDLNAYYLENEDFANYNIYGSYNFQTSDRTLSGNISAGISYSGLYQNINNNATADVEYKLSPAWAATAYFNYVRYSAIQNEGYVGDNFQFRAGIKKYFRTATSAGNHKLSFILFEDDNFNGALDADEAVLPNEVIMLDNFVAMTDHNGKVTFQNVPKGAYTLKVNERTGARMMMDPMIVVHKNRTIKVGLVKNVRVAGKLSEVKQQYDEKNTDVSGLMVYAKDEQGNIQTAVVNRKHEFEFFLTDGFYDIYIKSDKYHFDTPLQTIKVKKGTQPEFMVFEYKKKDTTIKVKKF
ncbi:hypothetical protein KUV50_07545 [Membranicola marinus]|uniref:SD-repeat containing protein B domain-containing protein n=1 Tax=Membranihabitans marinus TaxID=1227546 RepID=A0A953HYC6_9BACT|nr:hypothetical protein [Membranihabitans marinus]MBY5957977.1 hypothetical protein [Membranihabitans marinus]